MQHTPDFSSTAKVRELRDILLKRNSGQSSITFHVHGKNVDQSNSERIEL